MKRTLTVLAACLLSSTASANLVYNSAVNLSAQGFGNAPRDLTIQSQGNNTTESGCIAPTPGNASTPMFGAPACTPEAFVTLANGVSDTGGDEPQPQAINQKFNLPTFGSLGITLASQVGILFNATEPSGDSANVTDLTLSVYSPTGTRLFAIDGSFNFPSTLPGNGSAGFVFVVDNTQQTLLQPFIQAGNILGLGASLTDVFGGPESFRLVNLGSDVCTGNCTPQSIPEPGSLALLGIALFAGVGFKRRAASAN